LVTLAKKHLLPACIPPSTRSRKTPVPILHADGNAEQALAVNHRVNQTIQPSFTHHFSELFDLIQPENKEVSSIFQPRKNSMLILPNQSPIEFRPDK
jgi:hypothetical protein